MKKSVRNFYMTLYVNMKKINLSLNDKMPDNKQRAKRLKAISREHKPLKA